MHWPLHTAYTGLAKARPESVRSRARLDPLSNAQVDGMSSIVAARMVGTGGTRRVVACRLAGVYLGVPMKADATALIGNVGFARLLARAMTLRCPNCGRGRLFHSWFRLRATCTNCHLKLQRNEEADYWTGGLLVNFIIAELLVAVVLVIAVIIAWPGVDWKLVLRLTTIAAVAGPLLTWPFSRTLWLGIDLRFRPAEAHDFDSAAGEGQVDED